MAESAGLHGYRSFKQRRPLGQYYICYSISSKLSWVNHLTINSNFITHNNKHTAVLPLTICWCRFLFS